MFGGRTYWFAWFCSAILLLLHSAKVEAENKTDPTDNVNLSPIQIWRSTYYCFQKPLQGCKTEWQQLTITGLLNVTKDEVNDYCDGGCADNTRDMLKCLHLVNRHLLFNNNATVLVINETINQGCDSRDGVSTTDFKGNRNSAMKVGRKMYTSFITSFSTLVLIAMFNK